ncbi:MAG TPA: LysR family transcriptional regulator [Acidimicrobiales bacterium]|nr:LysR family transcriptional regulator [Acidimicrobiales bacterium]
MDLRQLNALTAVADNRTFSAAADALGTVQSNVSAHVARLEKELGVVLVDRSRQELTEEGEVVVARARRILAELEALVVDVAAVSHDVSGSVRLGMIGTTARWLAPRLLDAVAAQHAGVRVGVVEGTSALLEAQLVAGRLDLAVSNVPVSDDDLVLDTALFDEDLVLVVPVGHPMADGSPVGFEDLAGVPLLLPLSGTSLRDEIDAACEPHGVRLTAKAELEGVRLIASLTFEGYGPAVLPASAVPPFLRAQWASVPVEGMPRRRVGMVVRRRGLLSAPARAVRSVLADTVTAELSKEVDWVGIHPPSSRRGERHKPPSPRGPSGVR